MARSPISPCLVSPPPRSSSLPTSYTVSSSVGIFGYGEGSHFACQPLRAAPARSRRTTPRVHSVFAPGEYDYNFESPAVPRAGRAPGFYLPRDRVLELSAPDVVRGGAQARLGLRSPVGSPSSIISRPLPLTPLDRLSFASTNASASYPARSLSLYASQTPHARSAEGYPTRTLPHRRTSSACPSSFNYPSQHATPPSINPSFDRTGPRESSRPLPLIPSSSPHASPRAEFHPRASSRYSTAAPAQYSSTAIGKTLHGRASSDSILNQRSNPGLGPGNSPLKKDNRSTHLHNSRIIDDLSDLAAHVRSWDGAPLRSTPSARRDRQTSRMNSAAAYSRTRDDLANGAGTSAAFVTPRRRSGPHSTIPRQADPKNAAHKLPDLWAQKAVLHERSISQPTSFSTPMGRPSPTMSMTAKTPAVDRIRRYASEAGYTNTLDKARVNTNAAQIGTGPRSLRRIAELPAPVKPVPSGPIPPVPAAVAEPRLARDNPKALQVNGKRRGKLRRRCKNAEPEVRLPRPSATEHLVAAGGNDLHLSGNPVRRRRPCGLLKRLVPEFVMRID